MRVAISGAGVAGSALAYWLLRTGHTPTLIEHAPAFRTGGYVIDFWGGGYRVAKLMGMENHVRAAGYDVQDLLYVGPGGDVKASVDVNIIRGMVGDDFTSLPRGDLAAAIFDTVDNEVETIFADTITALDEHADGVHVTFENGPPREFDLVVGADGLHSTVRRLAFGPEANFEHYLGCKVAACVLDGYQPRDEASYVTYSVPGRQVGRFALRDDRTMFLFIFRDSHDGVDASPKDQLRRQFGDAGWECPAILARLDEVDDLYFDVVSQIQMERWSNGRVVLIGDAAGCISLLGGEGTGSALAEAYVLAGELQRADGDYRSAFDAYQARLQPLIKGKQAGAKKLIGFFATRTRWGLWFRDFAMRTMNFRLLARIFAGSVRDNVALPDYGM